MMQAIRENKVALVTGSVAGLGLGIADALAAQGVRVVLHGLAPEGEGRAAAEALAARHGVEALFMGTDLRDVAAITDMVDTIHARLGGLDILVNNAVIRHFSPIDQFSPAAWDMSLAVNLSAAFHLIRLALPGMKARSWGRIINMSSIYGERGAENRVDYVTTKTALLGLTRATAIELARTGITCNAVSPGTVPTPAILDKISGIAASAGQSVEAATADYLASRNPSGRFIETAGVGALIAFLCSDAAGDINAATLPVDGGWQAA